MAKTVKAPIEPAPFKYVFTPEDVAAVQAVSRGDATAHQQRLALLFIVNTLAGTFESEFWPGGHEGDRNTCFAGGRRFVGLQIVKLIKTNLANHLNRSPDQ